MQDQEKKIKLIPTAKQFRTWSLPSQVTYIAGWLAVFGFFWGIFTFVYSSADSKQKYELTKQNSVLLQKVFMLQSQCDSLRGKMTCESYIEKETGHRYEQIMSLAMHVKKNSVNYLDLGTAALILGYSSEAASWLEKAALQGNSLGQFNLGSLYFRGEGVKQDYSKAAMWYSKAAEQGDVLAQFNLATMYEKGVGVDKDINKSIKLYTNAAEHGFEIAQYNLALIYLKAGEWEKMLYWLTEAAEGGQRESQFMLAKMYEQGLGIHIPKDLKEASKWYERYNNQTGSNPQGTIEASD